MATPSSTLSTGTPAAPDPATERLSIRERLAYGAGDIGGNLVFAPVSAFLLFYLTDVAGIGAAIAGTLLLLGRVLDGTLDLIVGTLIDRTSTRWGKARPWILLATPVLVISFVLLFNVPTGLDTTGKEIYTFVLYFLCLGVGFVSSNLAYHTLLSVITGNGRMRISLTVIRTFFALITTLMVNTLTMPLITSLGSGQGAWSSVITTYAVVAAITFIVLFLGTRERVKPAASESNAKLPLRRKLGILVRNPYFFLIFGLFLCTFVLQGTGGVGVYFASDVLGDPNLYSLLGLVQIAPLILGLWFMPLLMGRFGKRSTILVGTAIVIAGSVVSLVDPTNVTLVLVGGLIRGIGGIPAASALFALVADVVDFGEWKSGVRLDGMTYAAATAGQNFGAGLGVALVGWLLAAGGYDGAAQVQTASAIGAETFLMLWLPLILAIVTGAIIFFLDIERNAKRMQQELAERRSGSEKAGSDA